MKEFSRDLGSSSSELEPQFRYLDRYLEITKSIEKWLEHGTAASVDFINENGRQSISHLVLIHDLEVGNNEQSMFTPTGTERTIVMKRYSRLGLNRSATIIKSTEELIEGDDFSVNFGSEIFHLYERGIIDRHQIGPEKCLIDDIPNGATSGRFGVHMDVNDGAVMLKLEEEKDILRPYSELEEDSIEYFGKQELEIVFDNLRDIERILNTFNVGNIIFPE